MIRFLKSSVVQSSGRSATPASHLCLQRKASSSQAASHADTLAPPIVQEVLSSPGQSLDPAARSFFEPRFGHDFSRVRVHTDATAAESALAVNAQAYAVGSDVVFGSGQYRPAADHGRRLIAHELAHVMQTPGGASTPNEVSAISSPGDSAEIKAAAAAQAVMEGGPSTNVTRSPATSTLHRLPFGIALPSGLRGIDPKEEAILRPVFGASLDYGQIHVTDAVGGGARPFTVASPPLGQTINIGPAPYKTPGFNPDLLIHESTHCWQAQHHFNPTAFMTNSIQSQALAAAAGGDAYCYVPGKPFQSYGAEQIAQQVERKEAPIIAHVSSVSAGATDWANVAGLSLPRWEKSGAPGVRC